MKILEDKQIRIEDCEANLSKFIKKKRAVIKKNNKKKIPKTTLYNLSLFSQSLQNLIQIKQALSKSKKENSQKKK